MDLNSEVGDVFHFLIEHIVGQSVFGNAIPQPTTRMGSSFKNCYLMTFEAQEMCR